MKKLVALIFTLASGVALFIPDPLPFIDEGVALLVFVNGLAYLGLDLRRFFSLKPSARKKKSTTIDIE